MNEFIARLRMLVDLYKGEVFPDTLPVKCPMTKGLARELLARLEGQPIDSTPEPARAP